MPWVLLWASRKVHCWSYIQERDVNVSQSSPKTRTRTRRTRRACSCIAMKLRFTTSRRPNDVYDYCGSRWLRARSNHLSKLAKRTYMLHELRAWNLPSQMHIIVVAYCWGTDNKSSSLPNATEVLRLLWPCLAYRRRIYVEISGLCITQCRVKCKIRWDP